MSWTSIENLEEIKNKKILFLDLETIGLVKNVKLSNIVQEKRYPNYKENDNYDSCRIVQFGYLYMGEFDYDYEIKPANIKSIIIKPDEFEIPEESIKIHGITNGIANEKGIEITEGLKRLKKIIKETDYIIGYNIFFDINILMNELNRKGLKKTIKKIKELKKGENILCVGELSKQYKNYKNMPSQKMIYKELFEKSIENIHNAQYDICATIEIMYWYNENKDKFIKKIEANIMHNIKNINLKNMEENYGKSWTNDEYTILLQEKKEEKSDDEELPDIELPKNKYIEEEIINKQEYINMGSKWNEEEYKELIKEIEENIPMNIICINHGRNKGGIKSAIKRLLDGKKITYSEELNKKYSIRYKNELKRTNDKKLDENELNEDNEIISLLVKKIESLKKNNKILKEEIHILKKENI